MASTDPREKLQEYLQEQMERRKRMDDPSYRQNVNAASQRSYDSDARGNLSALLMDSAAKMGTIGGKQADASPVARFAQGQQQANDGFQNRLGAEDDAREKRYGMDSKVYEYLADKQSKADAAQAAERRHRETLDAAERRFKDSEDGKDRRAKIAAGRPSASSNGTWSVVPGLSGSDGAPQRFNNKTGMAEPIPGTHAKTEDKPANEAQLASANFGRKAQDADAIIASIERDGYDPAGYDRAARDLPVVGTFTRSDDDRRYEQAQKEFIAAILRKESGGAITPDEFAEYGKIYFPQAGDGPDVIKQKAASRKAASDNLIASAGSTAAGQIANRPAPDARPKNEPGTATAAPKKPLPTPSDVEAMSWLKVADPNDPDAKVVREKLERKGLL